MADRSLRRLSPRAKYRFVRAGADEQVRTLVTVAPATGSADVISGIDALGGTTRSFDHETGLLTAELPAARLGDLAQLRGVVYVEADQAYGPS